MGMKESKKGESTKDFTSLEMLEEMNSHYLTLQQTSRRFSTVSRKFVLGMHSHCLLGRACTKGGTKSVQV
jgi:hypothetical protein